MKMALRITTLSLSSERGKALMGPFSSSISKIIGSGGERSPEAVLCIAECLTPTGPSAPIVIAKMSADVAKCLLRGQNGLRWRTTALKEETGSP